MEKVQSNSINKNQMDINNRKMTNHPASLAKSWKINKVVRNLRFYISIANDIACHFAMNWEWMDNCRIFFPNPWLETWLRVEKFDAERLDSIPIVCLTSL